MTDRNVINHRLTEQVRRAVLSYDPLRTGNGPITIQAHDGRVILEGWVRTTTMKRVAETLARGVNGVREVENRLVSDAELMEAVSKALADDPRLRLLTNQVTVRARLGTVYLEGEVASSDMRRLAEEVAAQVPGVREVVNQLDVAQMEAMAA